MLQISKKHRNFHDRQVNLSPGTFHRTLLPFPQKTLSAAKAGMPLPFQRE